MNLHTGSGEVARHHEKPISEVQGRKSRRSPGWALAHPPGEVAMPRM
ncbi:hypothetical protein DB31_3675 [Hyalangium minutum]|uniref:Uncharacterized protein n=1 Tax=Hyalangium minutum TaxID=394096 RepID=A0A085WV32_9BACT|nr:hypothetical protein DB31_3675 [Hyalangium minutum]